LVFEFCSQIEGIKIILRLLCAHAYCLFWNQICQQYVHICFSNHMGTFTVPLN
jgi:hypothetical protein